jgi:hypothetical protein
MHLSLHELLPAQAFKKAQRKHPLKKQHTGQSQDSRNNTIWRSLHGLGNDGPECNKNSPFGNSQHRIGPLAEETHYSYKGYVHNDRPHKNLKQELRGRFPKKYTRNVINMNVFFIHNAKI